MRNWLVLFTIPGLYRVEFYVELPAPDEVTAREDSWGYLNVRDGWELTEIVEL